MINIEKLKNACSNADKAIKQIDKIEENNFLNKNSFLYKKWHNNLVYNMYNGLIALADAGLVNSKFIQDIQHIIDKHPKDEKLWDYLKSKVRD